jgi:hypothetical protein
MAVAVRISSDRKNGKRFTRIMGLLLVGKFGTLSLREWLSANEIATVG